YFLNLSFLQFLAVFGTVSAISVALYLLDRSRRKLVVSTLRFWMAAEQPAVAARRRRIQQPWSLLLQLVSMALLVLAIGQLRLGTPAQAGRDHVIVLDTSAWMAGRSGNRTLMEVARDRARQYLKALPVRDRVMLLRADGMALPATAFEVDRKKIEEAITASEPGATALNLDQALVFARHIQGQDGHRAGEITFIGPGRTAPRDAGTTALPRNLRVISIPDNVENVGLRKVGMRRSGADSERWEIYVAVRNYGVRPHTVTLSLDFGPPGTAGRVAAGSRPLTLAAGAESETSFEYRTSAAGVLGVRLSPHDSYPNDDHAELELPAQPALPVVVYSAQPELLRPVLSATPRVAAVYRRPEDYRANDTGLVILDGFIPPERPRADSLWIDPPVMGSPIPVRTTVEQAAFSHWNTEHPGAAGLHARDFKLDRAKVFEVSPSDGRIGEVDAGPVIVARPGKPKTVVLGFHPVLSGMRYELATPLLFANLLRWIAPEIFRRYEVSGGSVGAVKLVMDQDTAAADVKVTADDGSLLPFTIRERTLSFFSGAPGGVKVVAGDREYLYSLTLPELWESKWTPPADAHLGVPRFARISESSTDLWPWLALAGALGLLVEWVLYGRFRRGMMRMKTVPIRTPETTGARG
ncbi:MAG: BatA and WFA domain-containing protein, partial [Candidatus Solibacter sp.]|nr:BatA and WFA domain-containing protein [Candidatus Solibacter sp.]